MKHPNIYGRACFKKNSSLHILAEKFLNDLFRILPENFSFYLSKILMTFFVLVFSLHLYTFICALYTTDMLFSPFFTLLSTLVTANTACALYFFLLHHCTNNLSSLHIFVHHCTFCASLHVKASPAVQVGAIQMGMVNDKMGQGRSV